MKKSLLLFDNDGVLVETEQWFFQANREILKTLDIDLTDNIYREIMINGKSALKLAEAKGFSSSEIENLRLKRDEIYHHYLQTKDLKIPGVIETLQSLRPHFKMAIVTTSMPDSFAIIHKNREITSFMDKIFTRKDYKFSKPHPEPYLTALNYFNEKPENAIIIEDSERGLKSALAANIDCIAIRNAFTQKHDFSKATLYIENIVELLKILL